MPKEIIEEYCNQLRRRQISGSMECARRTAEICRLLVTIQKHPDAASLIDDVRAVGHKLQAANPVELAIGNIVRRVLHMIREEAQHEASEGATQEPSSDTSTQHLEEDAHPKLQLQQSCNNRSGSLRMAPSGSLLNLLAVGIVEEDMQELTKLYMQDETSQKTQESQSEVQESDPHISKTKGKVPKGSFQWKRKHEIIDLINDLIIDLDNIQQAITLQGVEHIHAKEVILTLGMSDTTFLFLKEASKKREFQVVVAEGCPRYDGHTMASKLSGAGIQTTLISDSAVFAMMARANKVLVGAHAVLANGGVIVPCGINMVALAARKHSVPFVVLVGLHKLSPLFPHDPDLAYNDFKSPSDVVDFDVVAEAFSCQDLEIPSEAFSCQDLEIPSEAFSCQDLEIPSVAQTSVTANNEATSAIHSSLLAPTLSMSPSVRPSGPLVHVPSPTFDYVPPHLISLFVTDMGGYTPSYVYRLLAEFYDRNDYLLSKQLAMGS